MKPATMKEAKANWGGNTRRDYALRYARQSTVWRKSAGVPVIILGDAVAIAFYVGDGGHVFGQQLDSVPQ